jgi:hypothetical protein
MPIFDIKLILNIYHSHLIYINRQESLQGQ